MGDLGRKPYQLRPTAPMSTAKSRGLAEGCSGRRAVGDLKHAHETLVHESEVVMDQDGYQVKVLRSEADIEIARDFWASAVTTRDADMDFALSLCSSDPAIVRPQVFALLRHGAVVGLLIGRIEKRTFQAKIGYWKIKLHGVNAMTFFEGGVIGDMDRSECDRLIRTVRDTLRQGEAEVAFLPPIDVSHPMFDSVSQAVGRLFQNMVPRVIHYKGAVGSIKKSFLDTLTAKERYNYRRRERKILERYEGKIQIQRFCTSEDVKCLMDQAEIVAAKSYQRGLSVGFKHTKVIQRRLEFEAKRGWMRSYILYLDNVPVAFWIGSIHKGTLYSDFIGYDHEYGEYRPGLYLVMKVLEEVCVPGAAQRATQLDFGSGDSEWKKAIIGDQSLIEAYAMLFAPSIRGQVIRLLWAGSESINAAGKRVLKRTKMFADVKREWRKRVRARRPVSAPVDAGG